MAYTAVNNSKQNMNTKRWVGNASNQTISGIGFQPDFAIMKKIENSSSGNFIMQSSSQGLSTYISANVNTAQSTGVSNAITSFNSDGYVIGNLGTINGNGDAFCSWNWKAGGGQGSSNTSGTINSQYTSANTTAGFSVVTFTGTGSNATVGHGLGVKPAMIWIKVRNATDDWNVWMGNKASNQIGLLNESGNFYAPGAATINASTTTASVIGLGSGSPANRNNAPIVAYCFAEKPGYSKFNTYKGNGSATDGTFIYTGFAPTLVVCKTTGNDSWMVFTDVISGATAPSAGALSGISNRHNRFTEFNNGGVTQSAGTNQGMDMLSNGFKLFEDNGNLNGNGQEYIYMAWGQTLVGTNNIPATAR